MKEKEEFTSGDVCGDDDETRRSRCAAYDLLRGGAQRESERTVGLGRASERASERVREERRCGRLAPTADRARPSCVELGSAGGRPTSRVTDH